MPGLRQRRRPGLPHSAVRSPGALAPELTATARGPAPQDDFGNVPLLRGPPRSGPLTGTTLSPGQSRAAVSGGPGEHRPQRAGLPKTGLVPPAPWRTPQNAAGAARRTRAVRAVLTSPEWRLTTELMAGAGRAAQGVRERWRGPRGITGTHAFWWCQTIQNTHGAHLTQRLHLMPAWVGYAAVYKNENQCV